MDERVERQGEWNQAYRIVFQSFFPLVTDIRIICEGDVSVGRRNNGWQRRV